MGGNYNPMLTFGRPVCASPQLSWRGEPCGRTSQTGDGFAETAVGAGAAKMRAFPRLIFPATLEVLLFRFHVSPGWFAPHSLPGVLGLLSELWLSRGSGQETGNERPPATAEGWGGGRRRKAPPAYISLQQGQPPRGRRSPRTQFN